MKTVLMFLFALACFAQAATYYVDPDNGNNSNNGLGPDASHGTNKPWATLGKVFSTAVSGDVVYFAPGNYREVNTITSTSWTSETFLRGDPRNVQGFRSSGGVRKPPGIVRLTGYTTNDTTAGSASSLITLNSRDNITFEDFFFEPYKNQTAINGAAGGSLNITLRRCCIQNSNLGTPGAVNFLVNFGDSANLTVENCMIFSVGSFNVISITHTSGTGSDYDMNITIRNTVIFAPATTGIQLTKSGASANEGGGVDITGCTIFAAYGVFSGESSTTHKIVARNNYIVASSYAFIGINYSGMFDTDYNFIYAVNSDFNNTRGSNDQETNWSGHIDFGASQLFGLSSGVPPFAPFSFSPMIGGGSGNPLSTDLFGAARPNPNSIGAIELKTPPVKAAAK